MIGHITLSLVILSGVLMVAAVASPSPMNSPIVVFPESNDTLNIISKGEPYAEMNFTGWGKSWAFFSFKGKVAEKDGHSVMTNTATVGDSKADLSLIASVAKTGNRQLKMDIDLSTTKDTDLTMITATFEVTNKAFAKGKVQVMLADGPSTEVVLPLERKGLGKAVKQATWIDAAGNKGITLSFDPPIDVGSDGPARIMLAGAKLAAAAPVKQSITFDLPDDVGYATSSAVVPQEPGDENWFEFKPSQDYDKPSEIGMQNWIDAPAGKHGRIIRAGDRLMYNGKPIQLWGLNLCYANCAPTKEVAEKRAKFYRMYGVNAVRLHKYAEGGTLSNDSYVQFDPAGVDKMDYLIAKLKEQGIYVKFSAVFGVPMAGPDDKKIVPYIEEFGSFEGGRKGRITPPHSAVPYSPELQELQIQHLVALVKHKNPYTGLTYAEDPAIAFVETLNEQSVMFYTSMLPLKASATLRTIVGKRFGDWLRVKYKDQAGLDAAWGKASFDIFVSEGFPGGESLDKNNILPLGNPWYWDPAQLKTSQAPRKQRLLDTLTFLYELQSEFYAKCVKALREAGYQGEVTGSNWQAGRAFSHFLNLHTDVQVGTVDRHNYFGGGSGTRISASTMLRNPGSGILSSGLQQVSDRPFMLSEWIHVKPNEWGVEGPAIIGAYAMGLNGWDVSYMFQNGDSGALSDRVGRDAWDVTAPQVMGVFPAVARQIYRGDVAESKLVISRPVHVPSLQAGKIAFEDTVEQGYDDKTFGSDKVPASTLTVGRCVVEFGDEYKDMAGFDLTPYVKDGWFVSSTNQLRWKPGQSRFDGCFTMDTAGTKAVVGFAKGQTHDLGGVSIAPGSFFSAIYVTAQEPDKTIETSKNLLVVAIGRARNKGFKIWDNTIIFDYGKPPVVMEPIQATIKIAGKGTATVHVLDHAGRKTGQTLDVANEAFQIDGAKDKACYYLVSYP